MTYRLGIDMGTTRVVVAVAADGRSEAVPLGDGSAGIAAELFRRSDGTFLAGDGAAQAALSAPRQGARDFKRRLGDPVPLMVGGVPIGAQVLASELLRHVRSQIVERRGRVPEDVVVAHPATWSSGQVEALLGAARTAGFGDVGAVSALEAAALEHASTHTVGVGEVVAVHLLGGATFETGLLRRTPGGFEVLGRPEGIERLGGVDFDQAIFSFVTATFEAQVDALDVNDPDTAQVLAELRARCVAAKERLSAASETSIDVVLGDLSTTVRLNRADFEAMIRPSLVETVDVLRRAAGSAGVPVEAIATVVAAGGSAAIPAVAAVLGEELCRPVVVAARPGETVALGAALSTAGAALPSTAPAFLGDAVGAPDPFSGLDFSLPLLDSQELAIVGAAAPVEANRRPVDLLAPLDEVTFDTPVDIVFDPPTEPPGREPDPFSGRAPASSVPVAVGMAIGATSTLTAAPADAATRIGTDDAVADWVGLPPEPTYSEPAPTAAPYAPPPGPSRAQRPIVVVAVAVVMLAAVIGAVWASSRTEPPKPSPTVHAFAPASLPDGVLLTRTWRLTGDKGDSLRGEVALTNQGAGPVSQTYDEVIPKSVATSVGQIRFEPAYSEVIKEDPVVRYAFSDLPPSVRYEFTYTVALPPEGNTQERLDRLAADQVREEAEFKGTATPTLKTLLVTPDFVTLAPGQVFGLVVTGQMADGSAAPAEILDAVAWSSGNVNVATVDKGRITALAPGSALIGAQVGDLRREVTVEVGAEPPAPTTTTRRRLVTRGQAPDPEPAPPPASPSDPEPLPEPPAPGPTVPVFPTTVPTVPPTTGTTTTTTTRPPPTTTTTTRPPTTTTTTKPPPSTTTTTKPTTTTTTEPDGDPDTTTTTEPDLF